MVVFIKHVFFAFSTLINFSAIFLVNFPVIVTE